MAYVYYTWKNQKKTPKKKPDLKKLDIDVEMLFKAIDEEAVKRRNKLL